MNLKKRMHARRQRCEEGGKGESFVLTYDRDRFWSLTRLTIIKMKVQYQLLRRMRLISVSFSFRACHDRYNLGLGQNEIMNGN